MEPWLNEWTPNPNASTAVIHDLPETRPLTLALKLRRPDRALADPIRRRNILLASAWRDHEELWAIRMLPSDRLVLQLGTAGHRETRTPPGLDFALGLNYNPETGALAIAVKDEDGRQVLAGRALNPWSTAGAYKLVLSTVDGLADLAPHGWIIDASWQLGEVVS